MKWFRLVCLAAVAGQWVGSGAAADRAATGPEGPGTTPKLAPVLRPSEPSDSGQVMLPGPPPAAPAPKPVISAPPAAKLAPPPAKHVEDAVLRRPPAPPVVPVAPAKPSPLVEIGREVAAHCQKQIGHWKEGDARKLLGEPRRHRPAYDEKHVGERHHLRLCRPHQQVQGARTRFRSEVRRPAHRVRLSAAPHLAGLPPPLEWPRSRRRRSPGPQVLFLHQPPPGRAG